MRFVVISGSSGAGKSVALKALEDAGFFCIDNLPAKLLGTVAEHLETSGYSEVAVSIDARSAHNLTGIPEALAQLKAKMDLRVIFLDAQEDTLVKRFSETRRRHPLDTGERSLSECIREEKTLLWPIACLAHRLDTSDLSANSLRAWVKEVCQLENAAFTLVFQSFGFKHGIPLEADLVFDVRCLPNPYYDPNLRAHTGRDAVVVDFLASRPQVLDMLADIRGYLGKWLPAYIADNRNYFTVAIGCTGGQHRSVYFVETLAKHFGGDYQVLIRHRELAG